MDKKPVVFVVDNDKALFKAVATMLENIGLETISFTSAEDFLKAYDPEQPGCLLLDVRLPGMDGLKLQAELVERDIRMPIIFITGYGDIPMVVQAMKMGAFDFIEKPFRKLLLYESIKNAIALAGELWQNQKKRKTINNNLISLSDRERQVMDLLLDGKVDKQISQELSIGARTVAFHRANIMKKMNAGSVIELAKLFFL